MAPVDTTARAEPVMVGADGFATLALSCALILLSGGTTLAAAFGSVAWVALRTPATAPPAGRVLVLGVRLEKDGGIPPPYRRRLDRACEYAGRDIVVLGGRTRARLPSEAAAGAAYLTGRGIPPGTIQLENESRHTLENLRLYRARFPDAAIIPVALVTSRFHLARCGLTAAGLRLPHRLCAAESRGALRPADLLREAFLIHWYVAGRGFAWITQNRRMLARVS